MLRENGPSVFLHSLILAVLVVLASAAYAVPSGNAQSASDEAAVTDVILKFNQASSDATSSQDPTLIRPYVTDDFYQEMRLEMLAGFSQGLQSLTLSEIEWGTVSVTGDTAIGYTSETWAFELADGTTDEFPPQLNLYRLVRENGTWKVSANEHPNDVP